MGDGTDLLTKLSHELAARADAAKSSVAAIRSEHGSLSGVLWRNDVLATSAQSLPKRESYDVAFAGGQHQVATPSGFDVATNIAVLKLATPLQARPLAGRVPNVGELVSAYGADYVGSVSARLGTVIVVGDEWHSIKGGRIDKRLGLDIRLGRAEEGGPVFDMTGGFVGMSTFGPYWTSHCNPRIHSGACCPDSPAARSHCAGMARHRPAARCDPRTFPR